MSKAEADLASLLEEWDDATRWADMTEVEPDYERAVESASHSMIAAVAAAQSAVKSEELLRGRIAELASAAERQRDLVKAQVRVLPFHPPRSGSLHCDG